MKLSRRLSALCSMVPAGTILFDVGCDHAYVPIALVGEGRCPFCVASDLRSGALSSAREHVLAAGLADRIRLLLADGVPAGAPSLVDSFRSGGMMSGGAKEFRESAPECASAHKPGVTLLTAGMGGLLMLEILSKAEVPEGFFTYYLASPQRDADLFRAGLVFAGYRISDEVLVEEKGNYYPLILGEYTGEPAEALTQEEALLGPVLMKRGGSTYRRYLSWKIRACEAILQSLPENEGLRREEIETKLRYFKCAAVAADA